MKLKNFIMPHKGRGPQSLKKIPIQEAMPLKLKNRVSGKHDQTYEGDCANEVLSLVNCLKYHNYEQNVCSDEINVLNSCYKNYYTTKTKMRVARFQGVLVPYENNCTQAQIKKLFGMYPIM